MKTWQFILILLVLTGLGALLLLIFLGYVLNIPSKQAPTNITETIQRLETPPIDPTRDTIIGSATATTTIVAYMDFACSHCKIVYGHLTRLMSVHRDSIRLVWKDLPRTANQGSTDASIAARCASEQNRFQVFADAVYAMQPNFSSTRLRLEASTNGLNLPRFTACRERSDHNERLDRIRAEAIALGITGTPTLFVNNERIEGEVSFDTLQTIIERTQK